jgi:hypothetical protein
VSHPVLRRGAGRYDVLLAVVVLALAASPLTPPHGRAGVLAIQTVVLAYAIWTAGGRPAVVAAAGTVGLALVVATAALQPPDTQSARVVAAAGQAVLCAATIGTIGQALLHPRVTVRTLAGSLSIYLLFGLMFASIYALLGAAARHGFFAPGVHADATSYAYFSFITLTTVGFGDFVPVTDAGRMLAGLEALFGQLYLVTVVAVVVSNRART